MSEKHYQKREKLLQLSIFMFLTLIAIFVAGLLTASLRNHSTQTVRDMITENQEILCSHRLMLNQTLVKLCDEIERDVKAQQETKEALESYAQLTEAQHINNLIDLITTAYYPDIPTKYVRAIVYHESRYNPDIVNKRTGVQGLMQISPKWHTERAHKLGVQSLFDPLGNIIVGCDILNELTQSHDFNYALNFFAGGYPYANSYKNSISPFVEELNQIIEGMESGEIEL